MINSALMASQIAGVAGEVMKEAFLAAEKFVAVVTKK